MDDRERWNTVFCQEDRQGAMYDFIEALPRIEANFSTPETIRDAARAELARADPDRYPFGPSSAYVGDVARDLLDTSPSMIHAWHCAVCGTRENRHRRRLLPGFSNFHTTGRPLTVQASLDNHLEPERRHLICAMCDLDDVHSILQVGITVECWPDLLTFGLMGNGYASTRRIHLNKEISISSDTGVCIYSLKGVTYFKPSNIEAPFESRGGHYVSRFITDGSVYFNDGMREGRISRLEGHIDDLAPDMLDTCPGGYPSVVYYIREQ